MHCEELSEEGLARQCFHYFGIGRFREGQYPLLKAILDGENVLGILPTGAGKSICYQLPALMSSNVTLVISPLKSLMKDQVANLHEKGIFCAAYIDSSMSPKEKRCILRKVKERSVKILYLSPERVMDALFREELKRAIHPRELAYFVVDEAHCISEWGHDFRPAYLRMACMAKELGARQRIAVTATASPRVKKDILTLLGIPEETVFTSNTLDRKELDFHVIKVPRTFHKERALKSLMESLKEKYKDGCGLIFTVYAKPEGNYTAPFGTRFIHQYLTEQGFVSEVYHGKMPDSQRLQVQDAYKSNAHGLLVATKGFGMGIDKPDIRYVIHMCYPPSLEAYYQEAGRAGRDRQAASVFILARSRLEICSDESAGKGLPDPPCCSGWECFYEKGEKCDFGVQAKFIHDRCTSAKSVKEEFFALTSSCRMDPFQESQGFLKVLDEKMARCQMFLHHMSDQGLIAAYLLERRSKDNVGFRLVRGSVSWDEDCLDKQGDILAEKLMKQKRLQYKALEKIRAYAEAESGCRKQILMDYFADGTDFGPDGCGRCDLDIAGTFYEMDLMAKDTDEGMLNEEQAREWWRDKDFWKLAGLTLGVLAMWCAY